jgi:hypothetical protein
VDGTVAGVAGTVGVAGTAGIEGGPTEAGITDTGSITPDIIDITAVGVGLPVDTTRGGCFRCRCHTRITDITAPVTDTDMDMGTDLATGTGTDIDGRSLAETGLRYRTWTGCPSWDRSMM